MKKKEGDDQMYKDEIGRLKKVLKENSFYGRLGKLFKTENKFYFYDLGTGKIFECSEDEYVILQKILSSQDIEEILNLDSTILNRSLNILVDTIEKEFMLPL